MRIACLLVPDLPLRAELRASPELAGESLVIASGPGTRAEILTASREAMLRGVRAGQTLPQARAVCPELVVRIASPALERTAREAMLDVALSLAPRAELAERGSGLFVAEGAVFVDARGIEALHGDGHGREVGHPSDDEHGREAESAFASRLHARAERAGLPGFVALAGSREVARLATRQLALTTLTEPRPPSSRGRRGQSSASTASPTSTVSPANDETTRILPPGRELDFLGPLPVDLLDPDDRTAQALTRFGIHRIQDLLRLSRRDLAARLGPGLLALVARARGEQTEPPLPEPSTSSIEEGLDLESPIERLEPLAFVLRGLVARLAERLSLRALGCTQLHLTLRLEDGATRARRIGVASPSQDERVLLRLLRLAIEADPPSAPIDGVFLEAEGQPLQREQLDLFLPRGPSPSALDQTLAELCSICGADRVGAPEVVDDHRPDAFGLRPFRLAHRLTPARRTPRGAPPPRRGPRLSVRALRPPLRAEVRLVHGRPVHLHSAVSRGRVIRAAGPWRTTGGWWSEAAHFAIDHYDVQMSDGTLLRIGFDWKAKRWQIDGLYD